LTRPLLNIELMDHFINGEMRTFNLLPGFGRIQCATLILAGEDDPILPVEDSEDIAGAIPSHFVRLERFSNAGHGVFRDEPTAGFKYFVTSLGDAQGYCRRAKPRGVRTRQRSSNVEARAVFPEYYTRE
jgi:pimeloyl-ACP methyl ester carboxylesterase